MSENRLKMDKVFLNFWEGLAEWVPYLHIRSC